MMQEWVSTKKNGVKGNTLSFVACSNLKWQLRLIKQQCILALE